MDIINENQKKALDLIVLALSGISAGLGIYGFFKNREEAKQNKDLLHEIRQILNEVNQKI